MMKKKIFQKNMFKKFERLELKFLEILGIICFEKEIHFQQGLKYKMLIDLENQFEERNPTFLILHQVNMKINLRLKVNQEDQKLPNF